ncbi:bifunctional 3-phenylpropionate/cinnamic acid dioxygenase ferredoxin subunit [Streptomyces sp. PT12]|uniref:bifunctional 3-phenylpropionate/cinnamic acid dioxygenase ferredoxin subunit n=1 Tax=Streptomyces sp. PT12 TaxID=1510197 RepID=UPI000DE44946|nr:bifunctional 3-phenylpropionate/cinnamic acid dioxygenase ferredoxin subunit [Streptomyces sp. PT12]RBM15524.1 bifunctional 3-phenylpropionate/cinnamic acid dioxygenase ferredoxin subunit [Streptomyces sp. PT12]
MSETAVWTRVCAVTELSPGEAVRVPGVCPPIALFNVDGAFYAVDDTCSHAEFSLSQGYLDGETVECDLHFATFSVRTGAALSAPAVTPLGTFPVRVEDDWVLVDTAGRRVTAPPRV